MNKKEKILTVALNLFAEYGFHGVTTARIAKEAEVSEGLIFKHYKNKQTLLDMIYAQVDAELETVYAVMFEESNPNQIVQLYIDSVSRIKEEDYAFWKLVFKLKWDDNFYRPEKMQPVRERVQWAFRKMKYENPEEEAKLLVHTLDSIAISILRDGLDFNKNTLAYIKKKYQTNE